MARASGPGRQTKGGVPVSVGWGLNKSQRYLFFDNQVSLLLYL